MAKFAPKTAPKKSAAREFAAAEAAEAPVAKTRNRQSVLIKLTASKLHDLIGDAPIGVSRKELTAFIAKGAVAAATAAAGL